MSYTILVVDDSAIVRAMVHKSIAMAGLPVGKVLEAGNGREALELLADEWVDVVFADLNMPVMGGAELVERMSRDPALASTPVVVVSSEQGQGRVDELLAKGARAYVRKPFRPEGLKQVVEAVLGAPRGAPEGRPVTAPTGRDLGETLAQLLEEAAFLFTEPANAPPPFSGPVLEARLAYLGPQAGELRLVADTALAASLAANLLGEEAAEGSAADALGEILNMFVGLWTARLSGERDRYAIELPRVVARPAPAPLPADACVAHLVADGGLRVDLALTQPAEATP